MYDGTRLTLVTEGRREAHVANDLRSHVREATGGGTARAAQCQSGSIPATSAATSARLTDEPVVTCPQVPGGTESFGYTN